MREIKFRQWNKEKEDWEFIAIRGERFGEWTGLLDKNDVKIYEGDIVEFFTQYGVVEWAEWGAWSVPLQLAGGHPTSEELVANHADRLSVIGNIHENPELLK